MRERKVLEEAAKVLESDLAKIQFNSDNLADSRLQWRARRAANIEAAILTLRGARDEFAINFPNRNKDPRGAKIKSWTIIARRIAVETLLALRRAGSKQKTFGHVDGPLMRFVEGELKSVLGGTRVPARCTILEAISSNPVWNEMLMSRERKTST